MGKAGKLLHYCPISHQIESLLSLISSFGYKIADLPGRASHKDEYFDVSFGSRMQCR